MFAVALVFFGGPLLWVLSLSIRTQQEVYITSLRLIPETPYARELCRSPDHSAVLGVLDQLSQTLRGGSVGAMVVAAPAAYAFSRLDFRGNSALLIGVLALQMISQLVVIIPLYRYFARLNLLDSHFSTSMVYIAILVPLATWMLKGFFDGIPPALDEAAMVDGCTRFGAFRRVVLPLILPGLTSVFVLTAILAWGEFIVPYILLSKPSLLPDLYRHPQFPGQLRPDLDPGGRSGRGAGHAAGHRHLRHPAAVHRPRPDLRSHQGLVRGARLCPALVVQQVHTNGGDWSFRDSPHDRKRPHRPCVAVVLAGRGGRGAGHVPFRRGPL